MTDRPVVADDRRHRGGRSVAPAVGGRPVTDPEPAALDVVDVWGHGSFPASDPPANW